MELTWEIMAQAEHDYKALPSLPGVSLANPQTVHGRRAATCSSVATRTSLGDVNRPLPSFQLSCLLLARCS